MVSAVVNRCDMWFVHMCRVNAATAVQQLVIMGGNESYNQFTSTGAEFNFYCDPDAADLVIRKVCLPARQTAAWLY